MDIEGITKYIREKLYANYTVIVCLKDYQLHSFRSKISLPIMDTTMDEIYPNKLNLVNFSLDSGFQYKNYIFLTGKLQETFKSISYFSFLIKAGYPSFPFSHFLNCDTS